VMAAVAGDLVTGIPAGVVSGDRRLRDRGRNVKVYHS
jgi:hypothetical protein